MLLGLNGEVLSKLGHETPMERLKREANEVVDLLPKLQSQAYAKRSLFGPFELDTFKSGRYSIEYSFEEHEPVPQLIAIFQDNGIYSDDFVELVFAIGKQRSMKNRLEKMQEQSPELEQNNFAQSYIEMLDRQDKIRHTKVARYKAQETKRKIRKMKHES